MTASEASAGNVVLILNVGEFSVSPSLMTLPTSGRTEGRCASQAQLASEAEGRVGSQIDEPSDNLIRLTVTHSFPGVHVPGVIRQEVLHAVT